MMIPEVSVDHTTVRNNTVAAQITAGATTVTVPMGYGTKFEPDTNDDGKTFTGGILGGPLIHRWRVCVQGNCPAGVWSVLPTTLRDAGKIYQADLRPLGVTDFYGNDHIVTNGKAWVHEAHYPAGDFGNVTTWSADNTFTITGVIAFATTTLQGTDPKMYVQSVGYSYTLAPVAAKSGTTITTTGLTRPGTGFTPRYWLMRRPEFLSDEQVNGSYWVDHTNQVIYFVAEGGGPPNDVRVAVSQRGIESQLGAAETCTFQDFEVGCTRNEGVLSTNGSIKLTRGEVWGAAYDGIKMHRKEDAHTAFDCQVDGVNVHDTGEVGVLLAVGNRRTGSSEGTNWVKRCNVSKSGNRYRLNRAGIALQAEDKLEFDTPSVYTDERLYGCKMTAEDNYVHDIWGAGILVNGTANTVRGNLFVDCCTMAEDISPIYVGGGNPSFGGHDIDENTTIDCYSRSGYDATNPDVMCVYLDDGAGSSLVQNNTFQNYTYGYFSNGGGRNDLYNNTFIQGSATARAWLRLNGTLITDSNALPYETADTPPGTAPQSITDRIAEISGWFDAEYAAARGTHNLGALSPDPVSWRLPVTTLSGNVLDNRASDSIGIMKVGNVVEGGEHDGKFGNETVGYFDIDAQVTVGASVGTVADPPETPPAGVPASR